MKLSPSILSLVVGMMIAPRSALAFLGPEAIVSAGRKGVPNPTSTSSSNVWASMSTMNLVEEEEEEQNDKETVTLSSSTNSPSSKHSGPLAASTVTAEPVSSDMDVDWDWEEVASSVFEEDERPIVLFDGVCNLCNGGVNFAMDHDPSANLRFSSLQSKVAQSLLLRASGETHVKKIVLVTKENTYFSSDAVVRICQRLEGLPPIQWVGRLGQFTPEFVREPLYKFVSKHRYHFGENDSCRLDLDGTLTSRFVSDPVENSDA